MSLAKRKLVIVLPPMLTVPWFSSASVIILSTKMLKRVGESKNPCLTPTVVLIQSSIIHLKYFTILIGPNLSANFLSRRELYLEEMDSIQSTRWYIASMQNSNLVSRQRRGSLAVYVCVN